MLVVGVSKSFLRQAFTLREVAKDLHSWGVGIAAVASNGVGLAYRSTWGQTHLTNVFKLDKDTVSMYLMLLVVVFALASIPTEYLSDVLKKRKPFLLASTATAVTAWVLMYFSSVSYNTSLLIISFILVRLSQGLLVIAPTMAKELYNPKISGTATAFSNIIFFTGVALLQSVYSLTNPLTSIIVNVIVSARPYSNRFTREGNIP